MEFYVEARIIQSIMPWHLALYIYSTELKKTSFLPTACRVVGTEPAGRTYKAGTYFEIVLQTNNCD